MTEENSKQKNDIVEAELLDENNFNKSQTPKESNIDNKKTLNIVNNVNNSFVYGDANIAEGEVFISPNIEFKKVDVPYDKALERLHAAAKLSIEQLEQNYNQVRKESSRFFWLMLASSGLGFTVIIFSVVLLCIGKVTAGIVGTAASTIPNATSFLFFKKENELRRSIEKYHGHLIESHKTSSMIDLAETITNSENKDHIKRTIIFKVLEVDSQESANYLVEVAKLEQQHLESKK